MSNLALYRKYRSSDFDEVVGQPHVVKIIEGAIDSGRHSHAYLLTGPRGVGKTTVARIIAKRINKLGKDDNIADQLDIIEIDGASHRGIDEIRNLREKIILAPTKLKYKVYIIDEVHMLTKDAFNALLKTLEEPPEHAVFVFATTEAHKLPSTIISRTQRFDFRPINKKSMQDHLRYIAGQEKITIDDQAIAMICKLSRGGFRDAISLLDQLSASSKITIDTVAELTGWQDPDAVKRLVDACSQSSPDLVIEEFRKLLHQGTDVAILVQQILDYLQDCMGSEDNYELGFVIRLAESLHWVQQGLKSSTAPELLLQTGLLRTTQSPGRSVVSKSDTSAGWSEKKPKNIQELVQPIAKAHSKSSGGDKPNDSEKQIKSLSIVKHYNNSLYAVLRGARISINDGDISVACRFSFHRDRINEPRNLVLIAKAFGKVYGREMSVKASLDQVSQKEPQIDREQELMSSAMAILGGEVVDGQ